MYVYLTHNIHLLNKKVYLYHKNIHLFFISQVSSAFQIRHPQRISSRKPLQHGFFPFSAVPPPFAVFSVNNY